jgi:hypothetical protein
MFKTVVISSLLTALLVCAIYEVGGGGFVPGLKKCIIITSPEHEKMLSACPACPPEFVVDRATCAPCPKCAACAPCPKCAEAKKTACSPAATPPSLKKIFLKAKTDKGYLHGYYRVYDRILAPLQNQPISMLEIGVDTELSIHAWQMYFPKVKQISGIAFQTALTHDKFNNDKKTSFFVGSQDNPKLLARVCNTTGPFDLIIDDGSHIPEHQIASFEGLIG